MSQIIQIHSPDKKTASRLRELISLTNKENPKPEDLAELRRLFKECPEIALEIGNTQRIVFNYILEAAVASSALTSEATRIYIKKMKDELGYPSSTFLEQMLIDEVIMRWLRLNVMENDHQKATYESHSFEKGIYYDKRLDIAHKRYLRATETLAKVRKMIAQTQMKGAKMYKDLLTGKDGEKSE